MTAPSSRDRDRDAARVRRAYQRYRDSPAKRRAWDPGNPGNVAIREELLGALVAAVGSQLAGRGAILDAGCGSGYWLARLVDRGIPPARLHGIDLLESRTAAARSAVPGARVATGDVTAMPYDDESFDLVLLLTVLSSLPSAAAVGGALREVRRVLAPDGTVAVYEPRTATPANRATRRIRPAEVAAVVGPPRSLLTLTLAPPLARRLGRHAEALYPKLAAVRPLQTHWFGAFQRPGSTRQNPPTTRHATYWPGSGRPDEPTPQT